MAKTDSREHKRERKNKEKEKIYNWGGVCSAGLNKKNSNDFKYELKFV
jgi:hypothetical protein